MNSENCPEMLCCGPRQRHPQPSYQDIASWGTDPEDPGLDRVMVTVAGLDLGEHDDISEVLRSQLREVRVLSMPPSWREPRTPPRSSIAMLTPISVVTEVPTADSQPWREVVVPLRTPESMRTDCCANSPLWEGSQSDGVASLPRPASRTKLFSAPRNW
mmetsp:Transcript_52589/g.122392  ORF Transcript_52589/g.122392 Transcript_52589/m.122392 type:complete len:159 (-) Transcript_52589:157-633(-)